MVRSVILPGDRKGNRSQPVPQGISVHEKIKDRYGKNIQRPFLPVYGITHNICQKKDDHPCIAESRHITDTDGYGKLHGQFRHKFRVIVAFHRKKKHKASEKHNARHGKHPVRGRYSPGAEQKIECCSLVYVSPKRMSRNKGNEQNDQEIQQDKQPEHKLRDLTYFFKISFYGCCFF